MTLLITGATGSLGQKLSLKLSKLGHELILVSRSQSLAAKKLKFPHKLICKNLGAEPLLSSDYIGVDAVIHLMGESVDGRWTAVKKSEILSSRVSSSKNLLLNLPQTVQVVISASAQGYYGDCGDQIQTEQSPKGFGFLSDVCEQWEAPFRHLKQRAIQLRTGVILDPESGALKKMLSIFRNHLGAALASGEQFVSWISMDDMVDAIIHILETNTLTGPVNLCTPEPVTNQHLTTSLCQVLNVFELPKVPKFVLQIIFGEMSSILTDSIQMRPSKLLLSGFKFRHPNLKNYLNSIFNKTSVES